MKNYTLPLYFNLTMFVNIGPSRYPVFFLCLLLYCIIIIANVFIVVVILLERSLHDQPMYIFVLCLCINSMYGSSAFFVRFLIDLLSKANMISRPACYTQSYIIYVYACSEMTILSIMAYDRYIAVCEPLRYHYKMPPKMVLKLAGFAFIYPIVLVAIVHLLSSTLPLCGNEIQKVFCANWNVVKLSCVSNLINNIAGMLLAVTTVFLPLIFVLYTYLRIVIVVKKGSSQIKGKTLQSVLSHSITFVIYCFTGFCDVLLSRFNIEKMNPILSIFLSLGFLVIPPIMNPLVYGLSLPDIRKHIFNIFDMLKSNVT